MNAENNKKENTQTNKWMAIGTGFGLMFGVLFDNIALGLMFGLMFGSALDAHENKSED